MVKWEIFPVDHEEECFRVADNTMMPTLARGDLVFFDTKLRPKQNDLIVVRDKKIGSERVMRLQKRDGKFFIVPDDYHHDGLCIGRQLKRNGMFDIKGVVTGGMRELFDLV